MNKEELRQYSAKLLGEKEELQERIDRAIEYIENDKKDKCMEDFKTGIMTRELKILEILKGDDKE